MTIDIVYLFGYFCNTVLWKLCENGLQLHQIVLWWCKPSHIKGGASVSYPCVFFLKQMCCRISKLCNCLTVLSCSVIYMAVTNDRLQSFIEGNVFSTAVNLYLPFNVVIPLCNAGGEPLKQQWWINLHVHKRQKKASKWTAEGLGVKTGSCLYFF